MSWRFRQSFKILPGLRLNLSKSGLSASIGGAPFTLNLGSRGLSATASIPGTGISLRHNLSGAPHHQSQSGPYEVSTGPGPDAFPTSSPDLPPPLDSGIARIQEIRSASTELLTSEGLTELKRLILTAYEEHEQISRELVRANQEESRVTRRFQSWNSGFVLKNLFKGAFEVRRAEAEIASERKQELEEQLRLTTIATQVELAAEQAEPFFKMRDDFTTLADCAAIWDIKAQQKADQFRERTTACRAVSRERVQFTLSHGDLINWDQEVPHLKNAAGGDLFLYPGFILYRASRTAFSVIDFHDVAVTVASVKFHEEEAVPADSQVVGQTWAKTNKDGSRDRRFAENYEVPIALYGDLTLKSSTGLWEEFQFSDSQKLERFAGSWKAFVAAFDRRVSIIVSPENNIGPTPDQEPARCSGVDGTEVHFECTECHQPIEVNADAAGQEFRCPSCGASLAVPQP